jgi:DNA-directed RNA polymerase I subunit RPA1
MDIGSPLSSEISSLSFTFLTTEDVRSISVQKVDNPILLDNLNLPNRGGLYDPKLGPMSGKDM